MQSTKLKSVGTKSLESLNVEWNENKTKQKKIQIRNRKGREKKKKFGNLLKIKYEGINRNIVVLINEIMTDSDCVKIVEITLY